jgi:membrane protease YdiL (CAAX protease family)
MDIEKRRLKLFLILAFGISWASALVIALTGGLVNSPELIPGTGITLALVLEASVYMWGPALANIITRAITKESWQNAFISPKLKSGWPYWLAGWFGPGLATILGIVLFFAILPQYYDPNFTALRAQLQAANSASVSDPVRIIISQTLMALLISPILNGISTFGEEFGWRAYLLPKLSAAMGNRKALLLSSVIWGVWHWPVIAMGHNYGLDYWGYPWLGLLLMVWFTLSVGVFIGWISQKAGSVWPAVIAHGALNGIAALGLLFTSGPTPLVLGPTPAGVISCIPFTVVSAIILAKMKD